MTPSLNFINAKLKVSELAVAQWWSAEPDLRETLGSSTRRQHIEGNEAKHLLLASAWPVGWEQSCFS